MQSTSVETRWFFPDRPPADVESWFSGGAPVDWEQAPARTDLYLVLPEVDDLGIKVREGNFEVKGRISDFGVAEFTPNARGRVESWIKWSHGRESAALVIDQVRTSNALHFAVAKRRVQRRFRFLRDGTRREVPFDTEEEIDRGGFLELARLEIGGVSFWSLAFEIYPDDSQVFGSFAKLVTRELELYPGRLRREDSQSYPAWLGKNPALV